MKKINEFIAEKYKSSNYEPIEPGIFKVSNTFVTSISFQQEPEYGEGTGPNQISQYPLEDILDYFSVYVSDFYAEINVSNSSLSYLEFASVDLANIRRFRQIIGKHVYSRVIRINNIDHIELVIE